MGTWTASGSRHSRERSGVRASDVTFFAQDRDGGFRVPANSGPQLADLEIRPAPVNVIPPVSMTCDELLDDEKLDEILDDGPESPAADG
jgi:hypothetical protein